MNIQDSSTVSMQVQTLSGDVVKIERDSNVTSTNNLSVSFDKAVTTEQDYIVENENLQVTITLSNQSNIDVTNLKLKGVLSSDLKFVVGSVEVDDVSDLSANVVTGVSLADLKVNNSHVVKFFVTTSSQLTGNLAKVFGVVGYAVDDPIEGIKQVEEITEQVDIEVVIADVSVVNSVNKAYTVKGDRLHYVTHITNGTTSEKTKLFFTNPIPIGTSFVEGSVKIDDVDQPSFNPQIGFELNDLATSETVKVEFDVSVN